MYLLQECCWVLGFPGPINNIPLQIQGLTNSKRGRSNWQMKTNTWAAHWESQWRKSLVLWQNGLPEVSPKVDDRDLPSSHRQRWTAVAYPPLPPISLRLSCTLKFALELQRIQTPRRQSGSKNYKQWRGWSIQTLSPKLLNQVGHSSLLRRVWGRSF